MFNKIINYVKNSKIELKKVNWPNKKTITNYTLLVIGVSLAMAVFLGLIDFILTFGIEKAIIK
ncbi:MAG: Preprotein translocase subunit SecE [Parcubacteria group bacterium Athens1014_10]|nr:MAG: Preprotein translocase subunit SecE [Parcubacteria group bacterium Athens1014_10]TSD05511.1 MAG: Preprotein translocase subunit SecE [Parcubacteria group bacterium Athens0714_12]